MTTDVINTNVFVEQLTKAGMDKKVAHAKVSELVAKVNTIMPDELPATKSNIIAIKVREAISSSKADKFNLAVIAVSDRLDANDYNKRQAIKAYENDANAAVVNGLIKVVDGKPIPMDNKEFFDEGRTKKNFNYGKPIKDRMQREMLVVVDGNAMIARGDVNIEPGSVANVYGSIGKTGNILVNSEPTPQITRTMDAGEYYDVVYQAAKKSDIAMDVDEALSTDERGLVMVKGWVHAISTTSLGNVVMQLDNDTGDGLKAFSQGKYAARDMAKVPIGGEVIAIGRIRDAKDPKYGRSMNCIGVVVNPKSTNIGGALDKLKDFSFT